MWFCRPHSVRQLCGSGLSAPGLAQHGGQTREPVRGWRGSQTQSSTEPQPPQNRSSFASICSTCWASWGGVNKDLQSLKARIFILDSRQSSKHTWHRKSVEEDEAFFFIFLFLSRPFGWVAAYMLALTSGREGCGIGIKKAPLALLCISVQCLISMLSPILWLLAPVPGPKLQPQHWLPSGELLKTSLHMIHSNSGQPCFRVQSTVP